MSSLDQTLASRGSKHSSSDQENDSENAAGNEAAKANEVHVSVVTSPGTEQMTEKQPMAESERMEFAHGHRLILILVGLCLGIMLVALDTTLLATAIPTITSEFNSLNDIGWYGSAYFIAVSALQPLVGRIFQFFSPKWCYLTCIAVFAIGSLICALAPSSPVLIVGRAITGVGGAGLLPGSLIIVSFIAEPKIQPALNGLLAGTFGLASIVAPVIGGAFTQNVTWRWCFWINLPISGVTAILLVLFFKPTLAMDTFHLSLSEKLRKLDWIGLVIFSGANAMLLLALQWGGNTYAWNSSTIIGLLVGAVVTFAVFAGWQIRKGEDAGVPPRIVSQPVILTLASITFLAIGGFQVFIYYLPLFFQVVKGVGATESGVMYLPTVIADFICSLLAGGLIAQIGYYNPFFYLGFILLCIGLGLATTIRATSTTGFLIGLQILAGAGNGFTVQLPFTVIQSNIPLVDNSIAIASVVYFQFLGGAIFQAIAHQIFESRLTESLSNSLTASQVADVISQGASAVKGFDDGLKSIVTSGYQLGVTNAFYASIVAFGIAFLLSFTLKWKKFQGPKPSEKESGESNEIGGTP